MFTFVNRSELKTSVLGTGHPLIIKTYAVSLNMFTSLKLARTVRCSCYVEVQASPGLVIPRDGL